MDLQCCQQLFSALADTTRFRIVSLLGEGELCVCDLMSVLKEPQSKVSRHLAYLRRAGVVEARKDGLWMYYRLAQPAGRTARLMFDMLRKAHQEIGELKEDRREYQKIKKGLVACCS